MRVEIRPVVVHYPRVVAWCGAGVLLAAALLDGSWYQRPLVTLGLVVAVAGLRAFPIPLSKYS